MNGRESAEAIVHGRALARARAKHETRTDYIQIHWADIRQQLLAVTYKLQPVRRVEIPKPGGGVRGLGIPTVIDGLIQQAWLQVLNPIFYPGFSREGFGFRPGRSAHDAVRRAQQYIQLGYRWAVDLVCGPARTVV
ncbi:Reverse transcriptase (RNA-dependent DNA polymerase) [Alicyclobacillus macrosporangiidus]|uniref:Reverse transcriptase (RNA-dependent DNA polymerase) n=1 Tax=Alicyclobacillus macrosporangiidus TaxID=392015 RepID=A0A1I7LFY2_9BACL|nr:Reverse transcriptase (RNA-dependent DNA polymerase) [Alicyclobacillus macrosporangiidus]